jgi:hypothetical protein
MFCLEVGIEFFRITFYKNGSDYVRELLKTKKGEGWNDLNVEIEVTD